MAVKHFWNLPQQWLASAISLNAKMRPVFAIRTATRISASRDASEGLRPFSCLVSLKATSSGLHHAQHSGHVHSSN